MNKIKLFALTSLSAWCFSAESQVQNTNFEDWIFTDTTWDGQSIYIADQWPGGTRTEDSYSGSFAAKVEPYVTCGMMRTYMICGQIGPNFNPWGIEPDFTGCGSPVDFKPVSLSGYFQFLSPDSSDVATGYLVLKKFNASTGISEEIGRGKIEFSPTSDYVPFNIPVTDLQPGVMPDSIVISFSSGMGFGAENETYHYGTLYIDQLRIQKGSATAGLEENAFECSFFPNPTKGELYFSFESALKDDFVLVITDMSGRTIARQPVIPGIKSTIETGNLPAGTYVAFLHGNKAIYGREKILKTD